MDASFLDIPLDRLRDKRGMKWSRYGDDVIGAWVADMDFPVAPAIQDAIDDIQAGNEFGYPADDAGATVREAFADWMKREHRWRIDPDDTLLLGDVLQAMHAAILRFSEPGDGLVVQTPIYPPFLGAVKANNRRLDENPLLRDTNGYGIDFDRLRAVIDNRTKMLLLCNPHNPTGRAFSRKELKKLAEIVLEHDLIVVSDEIHMDLVYPDLKHIPFASLGPEIAARTITLSSASKSFNIAGLRCAVAHFGAPELRRAFSKINLRLFGTPSIVGMVATRAAWRDGKQWLSLVREQLDENRQRVEIFLSANLPEIGFHMPEATYLAWLDCTALELDERPQEFFLKQAKVGLNPGSDFSPASDKFVRLNFATPPAVLNEILNRMSYAVKR